MTDALLGPEPTGRPTWGMWVSDHPQLVLGSVLVLLVVVTGIIEPRYLTFSGLRNTVLLAAPLGIMAGAQTILMLTGGIDLSVGMIATAAAYVAANQSPSGAAIAITAGLLVGVAAGTVNGIGVGLFRVNPLIMTLAMSAILLGLFTALSFTVLQGSTTVGRLISTLGGGSFLGNRIPYNALVWGGVSLLVIYGLRRTGLGRLLYAVGDNPTAVRLAGVRLWQVHLAAYAIAGLLAALAGILLAGRTGAVDLQLGVNFVLPSVAAAVIGGTSIFGGIGTYSGTIFGALILGVLATMMTFLDAGQAIQQIVYGSILLGLAWLYARVTSSS
ncbi:MAG TPA: ABC transporter permease [Acidimicrobiia bacterium]|jgi:ribose transport system permease protein|nr:ABC transporter permease [Acidimicrobiia bacterium]HJR86651.1 ABC transporter permease [Acidimicrobiia bacterium]